METEFIYWRHPSLPGIKIEEVCGGEDKSGRLWREMACQVYCENGKDGYREIGHFRTGAPFLFGEESRISISHTDRLYVVATLPATPEVDLAEFSQRACMGVDAEKEDRDQAKRVRDKFLNGEEAGMIDPEDTEANVLAWTVKEACYKAVMGEGLDLKEDIRILEMPGIGPAVTVYDKNEFPEIRYGKAVVNLREATGEGGEASGKPEAQIELILYSYKSEGHVVTLAYSPRCAKFSKGS